MRLLDDGLAFVAAVAARPGQVVHVHETADDDGCVLWGAVVHGRALAAISATALVDLIEAGGGVACVHPDVWAPPDSDEIEWMQARERSEAMPKGVETSDEDRALLHRAVNLVGSVNEFVREHAIDPDRSESAVGQQLRMMLQGASAMEPGRSRILAAARALIAERTETPEVIDVDGEPYVRAENGDQAGTWVGGVEHEHDEPYPDNTPAGEPDDLEHDLVKAARKAAYAKGVMDGATEAYEQRMAELKAVIESM